MLKAFPYLHTYISCLSLTVTVQLGTCSVIGIYMNVILVKYCMNNNPYNLASYGKFLGAGEIVRN